MSTEWYSAQLKVMKKVGDPHSCTMHWSSYFLETSTALFHAPTEGWWTDLLPAADLTVQLSVRDLAQTWTWFRGLQGIEYSRTQIPHLLLPMQVEDVQLYLTGMILS